MLRFKSAAIFSLTFFLLGAKVLFAGEIATGWRHEKRIVTQKEGEFRIHFFWIDPQKSRWDLLVASDYNAAALPAKQLRERSGAALVINGGFFDDLFHSLGLMVRQGSEINPLRNVDWGIFQIKSGVPAIIHRRQWNPDGVELALQVGPRLVIDGKIPRFKPETERHRRSALGLTAGGLVLVAICENPIGIQPWAELLQKETIAALNLDGGGSSQISVRLHSFSLEVPGATNVPNAVAVFANEN